MAKYMSCEYCGSNLDFGEICDCKKKSSTPESVHPQEKKSNNIVHLKNDFVKSEQEVCREI